MNTKVFFVVNPVSAGKKTVVEWPIFEKMLKEKNYKFDWSYTEYPEHATLITREALKKGYDLIVSVGGDGTMNEVVNGFFEGGCPLNEDAKLAIFSRGTGCDFNRTFGIKRGFEEFIQILQRNQIHVLDVGRVNFVDRAGKSVSRLFLNISDVGLGGETTEKVNKTKKHLKGFFAFLIGTLLTIIKYRNKKFQVEVDGKLVKDEKMNSVIIANGKYFGGGMFISPNSDPKDGLLDIIIIGNFSTLELIRDIHLIYKGNHLTHSKVYNYKGKKIKVTSKPEALLEIDGEQPGTTPAEFEIIPQAIKLLI